MNKVIFLIMEHSLSNIFDSSKTWKAIEAWTSKGLAQKRVAMLSKNNPENNYDVQELEVNEES